MNTQPKNLIHILFFLSICVGVIAIAVFAYHDSNLPIQKMSVAEMRTSVVSDFTSRFKTETSDIAGVSFESFSVMNEQGDIEVYAVPDFKIFLTISKSPEEQAQVLKGVLEKMVQGDVSKLDYVDLRVEGKAYYKLK